MHVSLIPFSELLAVWYFLFPQVSRLLLERARRRQATAAASASAVRASGNFWTPDLGCSSGYARAKRRVCLICRSTFLISILSLFLSLSPFLCLFLRFDALTWCLSLFLLPLRPSSARFQCSLLHSLEHFKDFSAGPLRRVNTRYKMLFAAVRRLRGELALKGEAPRRRWWQPWDYLWRWDSSKWAPPRGCK